MKTHQTLIVEIRFSVLNQFKKDSYENMNSFSNGNRRSWNLDGNFRFPADQQVTSVNVNERSKNFFRASL